jgi:quinol monooxygenase YgiN
MIHLSGRLVCKDGAEAEVVRRELPEHIRLTRAEPGCLSFEVTSTEDPLRWHVSETFLDRAAFEAHQTRTRASAWYRATAGITRDFTQTED